ncbi:MAG: hypothetical protein GX311_03975 [Bacteroidales bacterium]|nr:hypothetical protein [Bacteroidales bacterium]
MTRIIKIVCFITALFASLQSVAQQEEFNPRKDFYYDEDYFRPYSPYLTLNAGYALNFNTMKPEQNFSADLHFRAKYEYLHFNAGYLVSTDYFFLEGKKLKLYRSFQRSHHFHAGVGTRYAILRHNLGGYAGLSLVTGRQLVGDTAYYRRLGPGLYLQGHYHLKPIYDIGVGIGLYLAISEHFSIFGLQLSIMFSGDYKPPAKSKIGVY